MDDNSSKKRLRSEDVVLDDDELNAFVDAAVASKKANICRSEQNGKDQTSKKQVDSSLEEKLESITHNLIEPSSSLSSIKNAEAFSLSHENITKINSGEWISVDLENPAKPSNVVSNVGEDIEFYWYDAAVDPNSATNTVYLFGKIFNSQKNQFESASLRVENVNRRVFLLPREYFLSKTKKVKAEDVCFEFANSVAKKIKISKFCARKVTKRYCFELSQIPSNADYLEVLFSGPQLEQSSGETYHQMFGTTNSILECLILSLNLKGPQWLTVKNVVASESPLNDTWCQQQFVVNESQISTNSASTQPSPKFTVLTLNMKLYGASEADENVIIGVSGLLNRNYQFEQNSFLSEDLDRFCILTCPSQNEFPADFEIESVSSKVKTVQAKDEKQLLEMFIHRFNEIDADIVVGHDLISELKYLLTRLAAHNISYASWTRLGKLNTQLNSEIMPFNHYFIGRLLCDTKISSKELVRSINSYDLKELSTQILSKKRVNVPSSKLPSYYTTSKKLVRLIDIMSTDNELVSDIMLKLNCLPLAKEITSIVGNLLSKTLLGGQSGRIEYLLLHAFSSKGYIVPDKETQTISLQEIENDEATEQEGEENSKSKFQHNHFSYVGGLCLEPKTGLYDNYILVMDFNSLYPSIIQEYNICFTTVKPNESDEIQLANSSEALAKLANVKGVLPTEIRKLVESRREAKRALSDHCLSPEERLQLDIKQKALKIIANSMYGCLGASFSRFYAPHLAALVTSKGREILLDSKSLVEQIGYEVIYGDTDSLMIQTNCANLDEIMKASVQIQNEINRKYNILEIEVDYVFRRLLLLKKKKYAGLSVSKDSEGKLQYNRIVKGLEIIRSDCCLLVRNTASAVLDAILSTPEADEDSLSMEVVVEEIKDGLQMLIAALRAGEFSLNDFVIQKVLTKDAEDYGRPMLHSMAAVKYNKTTSNKLKSGDSVKFVICDDKTKNSITQRSYHVEQARQMINSGEMKVDIDYYIKNQLQPVLSRLCEPIEGADAAQVAQFLGLEPKRTRARKQ